MAPRQLYRDDKALDNLLDNLLQTGQSDKFGPIASTIAGSNAEYHITEATITDGLAAANDLLAESKLCSLLPSLENGDSNIREVLANALTGIIRLSRCCKANLKLRNEAEHSVQSAYMEIDRLKKLHEAAKAKINKLESQNLSLRHSASESDQKNKRVVRRLTTDCADLKTKCANSDYRVNHLSLEAKKREREYTQLQQRVHSLMTHSKRLSIEPQIVASVASDPGRQPLSRGRSIEKEENAYEDSAEHSERHFRDEVTSENQAFRDLLLAIQEELDDLLVSNSSVFHESKRLASELTEQKKETPRENGSAESAIGINDTTGNSVDNGDSLLRQRQDSVRSECSPSPQISTTFTQAKAESSSDVEKPDVEEAIQPALHSTTNKEHGEPRSPPDVKQSVTAGDSCDQESNEDAKSDANFDHDSVHPASGTDADHPENLEHALGGVTPALTTEQMNLPFDMIRTDLEQSLKQKFERLREVIHGMNTDS